MDATKSTHRTDNLQPVPLLDAGAAAAVYATNVQAIPAVTHMSINILVLPAHEKELQKHKLIRVKAFQLHATTSAEIIESKVCTHNLQTDHITEEQCIPPWAERLLARMQNMECAVSAVQGAIEATNSSVNILEGAANNGSLCIGEAQSAIKSLSGSIKAMTLCLNALQKIVKTTVSRFQAQQDTVNVTNKHFLALEDTLSTTKVFAKAMPYGVVGILPTDQPVSNWSRIVHDNAIHNNFNHSS
jgi:hypothetical protein